MTGGVKESYLLTVEVDSVSADVLCYSARLGSCHICVAYGIEQRCLSVVNMTHNDHDRVSGLKVRGVIVAVVYYSVLNGNNYLLLSSRAELRRDYRRRVVVNNLIDGGHNAQREKLFNNLGGCHFQHCRKLGNNYLVRYFDNYLRLLRALRSYARKALSLSFPLR